jgi:hypothetical protein
MRLTGLRGFYLESGMVVDCQRLAILPADRLGRTFLKVWSKQGGRTHPKTSVSLATARVRPTSRSSRHPSLRARLRLRLAPAPRRRKRLAAWGAAQLAPIKRTNGVVDWAQPQR